MFEGRLVLVFSMENWRLWMWGGVFRAGERSKNVLGVSKMGKWTRKGLK